MKISIVIHNPADTHAPKFARAALEAGHEIPIVFFFHDAVRIADSSVRSKQLKVWQGLKSIHAVELAVCIAAATRRNLVDETALGSPKSRIAEGFSVVGLGQLIGAMAESDRLVTFAA